MKQKLFLVGLSVLLLTWFGACNVGSPGGAYTYTFVNNSSYSLNITPASGQRWAAFSLPAAQTRRISISDAMIYFNFDQSTLVLCDTSTPGSIVFTTGIAAKIEVIGTPGSGTPATQAYVTYEVGLETVEVNNGSLVNLPWSISFAGYSGELVVLTAIENPTVGYITGNIYEGATVVATGSTYPNTGSSLVQIPTSATLP